jgi:hypothetical protein
VQSSTCGISPFRLLHNGTFPFSRAGLISPLGAFGIRIMPRVSIPFPHKGVHRGTASTDQPPATTHDLRNVRELHVGDKTGGGKRDGLGRAFPSQIGMPLHRRVNHLELVRIADTGLARGCLLDGKWSKVVQQNVVAAIIQFQQPTWLHILGSPNVVYDMEADDFFTPDGFNSPPGAVVTAADNAVVHDGALFAAMTSGGMPIVGRWDGTEWSSLGGPTDGATQMMAIAAYRGTIYITARDPANRTSLYRWLGATDWERIPGDLLNITPLGGEFGPPVWAMKQWIHNGCPKLAVGGGPALNTIRTPGCDIPTRNLAFWDGNAWEAFDPPGLTIMPASVLSLAEWNGDLYIGTYVSDWFQPNFDEHNPGVDANDEPFGGIMRWDGENLHHLLHGVFQDHGEDCSGGLGDEGRQFFGGYVGDIKPFDDGTGEALWICGHFDRVSTADGFGEPACGIARWDGTRWSVPDSGYARPEAANRFIGVRRVKDVPEVEEPELYVAGANHVTPGGFGHINTQPVVSLGLFDGQQWQSRGVLGGAQEAFSLFMNRVPIVHAGHLPNDPVRRTYFGFDNWFGCWDRQRFFGWGPGALRNDMPMAMLRGRQWRQPTDIFGPFSNWIPEAPAFEGAMKAVKDMVYGTVAGETRLWIVGEWQELGLTTIDISPTPGPTDFVAGWDGAAWHGTNATPRAHGATQDGWYYDPNTSTFFFPRIWACTIWNDMLVVGGEFTHIGGVEAKNLAAWDGQQWIAIGGGVGHGDEGGPEFGGVRSLGTYCGKLVVGGFFTDRGSMIATWDGTSWDSLGAGINPDEDFGENFMTPGVYVVKEWGNKLYVGGKFLGPVGISSPCIASWNGEEWESVGGGIIDPDTSGLGYIRHVSALHAWSDNNSCDRLIVAGSFPYAGNVECQSIAAWDGQQFHPLLDDPWPGMQPLNDAWHDHYPAQVLGLTTRGGNLMAVGRFSGAGGERFSAQSWDWFSPNGQPEPQGIIKLECDEPPIFDPPPPADDCDRGRTTDHIVAFTKGRIYSADIGEIMEQIGESGFDCQIIESIVSRDPTDGGRPKVWAVDGEQSLIIDPFRRTIDDWKEAVEERGAGLFPENCMLAALYRGRAVLARQPDNLSIWYMSRMGNPLDYDIGQIPIATASVAGTANEIGVPADALTALIPVGDDYMLFGCRSSIWAMQGDPSYGGALFPVTRMTGVLGPKSWCFDHHGILYFLGARGLYRMAGIDLPQSISDDRLVDTLSRIDVNTRTIHLAYDPHRREVNIFITPKQRMLTDGTLIPRL